MSLSRKLDYVILDLIESAARTVKAAPLNLGAYGGAEGGVGGPPGGIVGWLRQTSVAYDETEAETLDTAPSGYSAPSGWSLLDNLNHIRYRLGTLESGILVVDEYDGNPSVSNVTWITFSGGAKVTELAPGHALVNITASGVGGSITVMDFDTVPTINNTDTIIFSGFLVEDLGSGDVRVTTSGYMLKSVYDTNNDGIVDNTLSINGYPVNELFPVGGDFMRYDVSEGWVAATIAFAQFFTDLDDAPNTLITHSGQFVRVNDNETALEFVTTSGGGFPNPFALTADITPAALGADQNNYNPTGLSTADVLRLEASGASRSITGLAGGADGRIIIIRNIGFTYSIVLIDGSTSSDAANRFTLGDSNVILEPSQGVILQYDFALLRWYMLTSENAEKIQDIAGAMVSGNSESGIAVTYDDTNGKLDFAADWVMIEDINLAADTASFDFQNIPATFKHLKIEFDGRSNRAAQTSDAAKIKFNNDGGNNYVGLLQWGAGQSEQATAGAPTIFTYTTAASSPANWFNNSEILIMDYANTNKYHSWQARGMQTMANVAGNYFIYDAMGLYLSLTAISRITLYPSVGTNFKQYSRATLYGMK